jgi:flagellar hook-length control protein FliK
MEGGGKGQEKILLMGNESAQFSKRAGQNDGDFYETSPVLKEGSTQMPEKLGEVKEGYSPASPKSEPQTVSQQVSQRAVWLIRNNEESVRITLDPPQLGHIYMVIDRSKEDIKATLWTDNPATKATLETNQLQIQKIIESEGFKLEKFDVFVQQDMGWYQGGKDDPMNPNPGSPASPSEIRAPLSGSPDPLPAVARAVHPASKYLDLFV